VFERIVAGSLRFTVRALTGARALWRDSSPSPGVRVYYGNHASHGDFVMIWSALPAALRAGVRPVAGAEYWNGDSFRRYLIRSVFNGVLIERDPARRKRDAIETLCAAVDGGASLIIFPEGTRNMGETPLLPFRSGIYRLAEMRPQLEFVPVWLDNLARVMPKGRVLPLPILCTATFGPPVRLAAGEDKAAFMERARTALLSLAPRDGIGTDTAGERFET
jgi:1-acyl-sn-glycerol-3-phosphate acyltransferase